MYSQIRLEGLLPDSLKDRLPALLIQDLVAHAREQMPLCIAVTGLTHPLHGMAKALFIRCAGILRPGVEAHRQIRPTVLQGIGPLHQPQQRPVAVQGEGKRAQRVGLVGDHILLVGRDPAAGMLRAGKALGKGPDGHLLDQRTVVALAEEQAQQADQHKPRARSGILAGAAAHDQRVDVLPLGKEGDRIEVTVYYPCV